jgi:putative membrane protein
MEPAMHAYLMVKTAHVVFVISWMASVFYLPRILVNLVETGDQPEVRARLLLMGRRLYRFGHAMFGFALVFGAWLAIGFGISGSWLHAKLALVALVLAHFIISGRWLKGAAAGRPLPKATTLRWFNELPVVLLVAIVYLVLAKPAFA